MLSLDQYHFTFRNLTERRYVCNYFSGDGAKEGFQSIYACLYRLERGICSAMIFLLQVHINVVRGIL